MDTSNGRRFYFATAPAPTDFATWLSDVAPGYAQALSDALADPDPQRRAAAGALTLDLEAALRAAGAALRDGVEVEIEADAPVEASSLAQILAVDAVGGSSAEHTAAMRELAGHLAMRLEAGGA
jgi:hypothetical protein